MTRNSILYGSPAAFLAGLLMVHCSSSSTPTTISDAGHQTSGTGSSSGSGSHSGSGSSSSSGSGSHSGTGTSSGSGSSFNYAAGDQPDACAPTEGGVTCSPGTIGCNGSTCGVPANFCCDTTSSESCVTAGTACAGTPISCNEAADCTNGQICCIVSNGTSKSQARVRCEDGPTCPMADAGETVARGQVCRSDNECASGKCQFWNCLGNLIQACANPVPSDTTLCNPSDADGGPLPSH